MKLSMIVAADENNVIGRGDRLPWHLPEDLANFRELTMGHALIAGRRTHDSIVRKLGRTLPGRSTVVLTRCPRTPAVGAYYVPTIESALHVAAGLSALLERDEVFVIGGAEVYTQTLDKISTIHLTRVYLPTQGDVRLPDGWLDGFNLKRFRAVPEYSFETYKRHDDSAEIQE